MRCAMNNRFGYLSKNLPSRPPLILSPGICITDWQTLCLRSGC